MMLERLSLDWSLSHFLFDAFAKPNIIYFVFMLLGPEELATIEPDEAVHRYLKSPAQMQTKEYVNLINAARMKRSLWSIGDGSALGLIARCVIDIPDPMENPRHGFQYCRHRCCHCHVDSEMVLRRYDHIIEVLQVKYVRSHCCEK